jgi:hypothetical protein
MKRVVLSCTLSSTYDFFLPISVRLWKKRVGYEPIVFLIGTREEWCNGHPGVVLEETAKSGVRIEFVSRMSGIPDSNLCMAVRQHAAVILEFNPSDLMLVGDVDLFPLRAKFYHQHDPSKDPIVIYHEDMYFGRYWPAYGPSMTVETWREVMDLKEGDLVGSICRTFEIGKIYDLIAANKANHLDSRLWIFDEQYASLRIRLSRFSNRIVKIKTDSTNERLCRNAWPTRVDASRFIDFHCQRPGWTEENFKKIRSVLEQIVPAELKWLDHYVTEYRRSGPSVKDPFA